MASGLGVGLAAGDSKDVPYIGTMGRSPDAAVLAAGLEQLLDERAAKIVIRVDAKAAPGGDGSKARPLNSLGEALRRAERQLSPETGVRVVLAPGEYAEVVRVEHAKGLLIIEAEKPRTAIMTGGAALGGWNADGEAKDRYVAPWPYDTEVVPNPWREAFGGNNPQQFPDLRKEMIFIDGVPLRQVLDAAELTAGTFLVNRGLATIQLKPGVDPRKARVIASARPEGIYNSVMRLEHMHAGLVVRGLVFRHAATALTGALFIRGSNVLVEDCDFEWNAGYGLHTYASNLRVLNCNATNNGGLGFSLLNGVNVLMKNCVADGNYWKWYQAGQTSCHSGGIKLNTIRNGLFIDIRTNGNHDHGFWVDSWARDIAVRRLVSVGNRGDGINFELSWGFDAAECLSAANGKAGFEAMDADGVVIRNSVLAFNGGNQIRGFNTDRKVDTKDWRFEDMIIVAPEGSKTLMFDWWGHGIHPVGEQKFLQPLISSSAAVNVLWFHPGTAKAFRRSEGQNIELDAWTALLKEQRANRWSAEAKQAASKRLPAKTPQVYVEPPLPTLR